MRKVGPLSIFVGPDRWQCFPIREIDDLCNLTLGAELEPVQLAGRRVGGSLAFAASDGIIFSSGLMGGNASVRGVASKDCVTFFVALSRGSSSRFFFRALEAASVIVVLPGDVIDVIQTPGCLSVSASLCPDRIDERIVEALVETGLHPRRLDADVVESLAAALYRIHSGQSSIKGINIGQTVLEALTDHFRRNPKGIEITRETSHEVIVRQAAAFIERHLAEPISIPEIAAAAGSSSRTLYRAMRDILGETPNCYVRRLRLHRIRHDLRISDPSTTVLATTRRWGINEHGRMAGWYRDLFGEFPSATLDGLPYRQSADAWL